MSFWNKIEKPDLDAPPPPPAQPARAESLPPAAAEPIDRGVAPPPAAAAPPTALDEAAAPRGNQLRLGRGVRLEGKLTFSGMVRIDATFQGSIVTDGVLVVGTDAKVDADIACGTVVIEGEVNGSVTASEAVELRSTATLRGDIESPSLAVERGATFDGASRRPARMAYQGAGREEAAPAPSVH